MTAVDRTPDAALMVIATVLEEQGYPKPGRTARLIASALCRDGWQVSAPGSGRATKVAVPAASDGSAPEAA